MFKSFLVQKSRLLSLLKSAVLSCWAYILTFILCTSVVVAADYMDELNSEAGGSKVTKAKKKQSARAPEPVKKNPDIYVDSLADEAGGLSVDNSGSVKETDIRKIEETTDPNWNYDNQTLGTCKKGLSHPDFEVCLRHNYFVSFMLYSKLNPVAKSMVYKDYQSDPDIKHINKVITTLAR